MQSKIHCFSSATSSISVWVGQAVILLNELQHVTKRRVYHMWDRTTDHAHRCIM